MNYLFYGKSSKACYEKCKEIAHWDTRPDETSVWMRISHQHHEFHTYICSSQTEMLNQIQEISQLKRIVSTHRHIIIVKDIHILNKQCLGKLKSLVNLYSDRTCFVLSSSTLNAIPSTLICICTPIRVPIQNREVLSDNMVIIFKKIFDICLSNIFINEKLAFFRDLSYTLLANGVTIQYFSKQLILYNIEINFCENAYLCNLLAESDISSKHLKKDIIAWERMLLLLCKEIEKKYK
jgi:hypothetical protein